MCRGSGRCILIGLYGRAGGVGSPRGSGGSESTILDALRRFLDGSYVTRDACDAAFVRMHERDAIGDRVHLFLAFVSFACVVGPVSVVEFTVLPLLLFFAIRVINTFPVWIHGFGQPVLLAALALAAWMGIGLLWSPDVAQGAESLASLRWVALVGFVYPVIERRGALIAALALGFLAGNVAQLIGAFDGFGIEALGESLGRAKGRASGWWDPAVGGSVLAAGLGLHLPAALWGRGRERLIGVSLGGVALAGLVATGTRGGWIAGAALLVCAGAVSVRRARRPWRAAVCVAAGALVVGAGAWFAGGERVSSRVSEARHELSLALEGDYATWTGARVSMMRGAVRAGVEHPLRGVGTGGFRDAMGETPLGLDDAAHAHNTALHVFAENGVIGVVLLVLFVLAALRGAQVRGAARGASRGGGYHDGPLWALLGLVFVSAFDAVIINTQTAALMGALIALSPVYAPGPGKKKHAGD